MHGHKITRQHGLYFLTFTVVGWVDVFSRQQYRDIVIDSLKHCQKLKGLEINAYVIMTNHIHLIANSQENELSLIVRDFKKYTSYEIVKSVIGSAEESRSEWMLRLFKYYATYNKNNTKFQFWKQDNKPIELVNPVWINQKINYTHMNPVKAGIVDKPEHYIYSSARDCLGENGVLAIKVIDVDNKANYF